MKLSCIITDDEPIAIEILEKYINMIPELQIVAKCYDAMQTFSALKIFKPDLLFLDVEMPQLSGLDFIRSIKNPPSIIFTTAYPNYAVNGFELNAVDYLLKPIAFERFLTAIDKVFLQHTSVRKGIEIAENQPSKKFLFIKSSQGYIRVNYCDIIYIEGLENYVKLHCEDKDLVCLSTMKTWEDILSPFNFLRIHRSFIVNLEKVSTITATTVQIASKELSIGRNYKKQLSDALKYRNL